MSAKVKAKGADSATPKYLWIRDELRAEIEGGALAPGEKMETVRSLARRFGVTVVTLSKALENLEQDGYVRRTQGSGIFVCDRSRDTHPRTTGILMPVLGHLYAPLLASILERLAEADIDAIPADPADAPELFFAPGGRFERFLRPDIGNLVIDGHSNFDFKRLQSELHRIRRLTFCFRAPQEFRFPRANAVLSRSRYGGYLAVKHLLDAGARRIIFLSVGEKGTAPRPLNPKRPGHIGLIAEGFVEGITESGGDPKRDLLEIVDDTPHTHEELVRAMQQGFDAIFCLGDVRAKHAYRAVEAFGATVGREIKVMGYFNTPWATSMMPALTSVSIREEEIGRRTAELIVADLEGEEIQISPQLIVRESTRPAE